MSFKCPTCVRTFSHSTAYTQHVKICLRKSEVEDEVEVDTEGDHGSNYERDNIEVIMLF
jgi:hypothetical protein